MATKLYPPQIEGSLPAFYLNYDPTNSVILGANITIPFTMNSTVSITEVAAFVLRLRTTSSNTYLFAPIFSENFNLSTNTVTFSLSKNEAEKLNEGQYYKVQIAYCRHITSTINFDIENSDVGYFSTVGIIKCTSKPNIYINGLDSTNVNFFTNEYIGIYNQDHCKDQTEKVYSYEFVIYNQNNEIYYTTGEQLHQSYYDTEYNGSIDKIFINDFIAEDITYSIQYKIVTINNLQLSTPLYKITNTNLVPPNKPLKIKPQCIEDNGYIIVNFEGELDKNKSSYYVINEDNNMNTLYKEKDNNGNYKLDKTNKTVIDMLHSALEYKEKLSFFRNYSLFKEIDNNNNFMYFWDSAKVKVKDNVELIGRGNNLIKALSYDYLGNTFIYNKDTSILTHNNTQYYVLFNIEQEARYYGSYILSRASDEDNYNTWFVVERFRLDEQLPSSHTVYDITIEHGRKYKYSLQQYNIWGLTSARIYSDIFYANFEDMYLYDGTKILKIRYNPKIDSFKTTLLEQKTDTIGGRFPFITRNGATQYKQFPIGGLISQELDENEMFIKRDFGLTHRHSTSVVEEGMPKGFLRNFHDFIDDNILLEREFKLAVLDWLNDGNPKLFKSPYEGNYIIRLMQNSLTPVKELGRLLHNFTSQAYEIAECNYDNLVQYGFINPLCPSEYTGLWKTYNLAELNKQNNGQTDIEIKFEVGLNMFTIQDMMPGDIVYLLFYDSGEWEPIMIGITGSYTYNNQDRIVTKIRVRPHSEIDQTKYRNTAGVIHCFYQGVKITAFDSIINQKLITIPGKQFIGYDPRAKRIQEITLTGNNINTIQAILTSDELEKINEYNIRDFFNLNEEIIKENSGNYSFNSNNLNKLLSLYKSFNPSEILDRINTTIYDGQVNKIMLLNIEHAKFTLRDVVPVYVVDNDLKPMELQTINDNNKVIGQNWENNEYNNNTIKVAVTPFGHPYNINELTLFEMLDPFCIFQVFEFNGTSWHPLNDNGASSYYDPYYRHWFIAGDDYDTTFKINTHWKQIIFDEFYLKNTFYKNHENENMDDIGFYRDYNNKLQIYFIKFNDEIKLETLITSYSNKINSGLTQQEIQNLDIRFIDESEEYYHYVDSHETDQNYCNKLILKKDMVIFPNNKDDLYYLFKHGDKYCYIDLLGKEHVVDLKNNYNLYKKYGDNNYLINFDIKKDATFEAQNGEIKTIDNFIISNEDQNNSYIKEYDSIYDLSVIKEKTFTNLKDINSISIGNGVMLDMTFQIKVLDYYTEVYNEKVKAAKQDYLDKKNFYINLMKNNAIIKESDYLTTKYISLVNAYDKLLNGTNSQFLSENDKEIIKSLLGNSYEKEQLTLLKLYNVQFLNEFTNFNLLKELEKYKENNNKENDFGINNLSIYTYTPVNEEIIYYLLNNYYEKKEIGYINKDKDNNYILNNNSILNSNLKINKINNYSTYYQIEDSYYLLTEDEINKLDNANNENNTKIPVYYIKYKDIKRTIIKMGEDSITSADTLCYQVNSNGTEIFYTINKEKLYELYNKPSIAYKDFKVQYMPEYNLNNLEINTDSRIIIIELELLNENFWNEIVGYVELNDNHYITNDWAEEYYIDINENIIDINKYNINLYKINDKYYEIPLTRINQLDSFALNKIPVYRNEVLLYKKQLLNEIEAQNIKNNNLFINMEEVPFQNEDITPLSFYEENELNILSSQENEEIEGVIIKVQNLQKEAESLDTQIKDLLDKIEQEKAIYIDAFNNLNTEIDNYNLQVYQNWAYSELFKLLHDQEYAEILNYFQNNKQIIEFIYDEVANTIARQLNATKNLQILIDTNLTKIITYEKTQIDATADNNELQNYLEDQIIEIRGQLVLYVYALYYAIANLISYVKDDNSTVNENKIDIYKTSLITAINNYNTTYSLMTEINSNKLLENYDIATRKYLYNLNKKFKTLYTRELELLKNNSHYINIEALAEISNLYDDIVYLQNMNIKDIVLQESVSIDIDNHEYIINNIITATGTELYKFDDNDSPYLDNYDNPLLATQFDNELRNLSQSELNQFIILKDRDVYWYRTAFIPKNVVAKEEYYNTFIVYPLSNELDPILANDPEITSISNKEYYETLSEKQKISVLETSTIVSNLILSYLLNTYVKNDGDRIILAKKIYNEYLDIDKSFNVDILNKERQRIQNLLPEDDTENNNKETALMVYENILYKAASNLDEIKPDSKLELGFYDKSRPWFKIYEGDTTYKEIEIPDEIPEEEKEKYNPKYYYIEDYYQAPQQDLRQIEKENWENYFIIKPQYNIVNSESIKEEELNNYYYLDFYPITQQIIYDANETYFDKIVSYNLIESNNDIITLGEPYYTADFVIAQNYNEQENYYIQNTSYIISLNPPKYSQQFVTSKFYKQDFISIEAKQFNPEILYFQNIYRYIQNDNLIGQVSDAEENIGKVVYTENKYYIKTDTYKKAEEYKSNQEYYKRQVSFSGDNFLDYDYWGQDAENYIGAFWADSTSRENVKYVKVNSYQVTATNYMNFYVKDGGEAYIISKEKKYNSEQIYYDREDFFKPVDLTQEMFEANLHTNKYFFIGYSLITSWIKEEDLEIQQKAKKYSDKNEVEHFLDIHYFERMITYVPIKSQLTLEEFTAGNFMKVNEYFITKSTDTIEPNKLYFEKIISYKEKRFETPPTYINECYQYGYIKNSNNSYIIDKQYYEKVNNYLKCSDVFIKNEIDDTISINMNTNQTEDLETIYQELILNNKTIYTKQGIDIYTLYMYGYTLNTKNKFISGKSYYKKVLSVAQSLKYIQTEADFNTLNFPIDNKKNYIEAFSDVQVNTSTGEQIILPGLYKRYIDSLNLNGLELKRIILKQALLLIELYEQQLDNYTQKYDKYLKIYNDESAIYNSYASSPEMDFYNGQNTIEEIRKEVKKLWHNFLRVLDEEYTKERERGMYL